VRWLVASVAETVPETARAVTLRLDVPDWPGHRAGQHVDVRLTAEDGYSTQRSYSIASPPGADRLELTVERIDDGEVSPYLTGPRQAATLTLTRESPPDWAGHRGRVDADMLAELGWPPSVQPHCYVCGPTTFVETVANTLVGLGHEPGRIRTERFGPTGG
jgi:ferredoxin-NADP reductase